MNRQGIGLLEVLVALTLTSLLAALTALILSTAVFRLRDRSERMSAENSLRVGAVVIRTGLESLGRDSLAGADLLAVGPSSFTARATRAAGVLCASSPGLLVARAGAGWWSALRDPVAGRDSLLLGRLDRPAWGIFALESPPQVVACPDGSAGIGLPVSADSLALSGIGAGSPLRVVENLEVRLYRSAPDDWLGVQLLSVAQPIQPFAGPMLPAGLVLESLDRAGLPSSTPAQVAAVNARLTSLTARPGGVGLIRLGPPRSDSVVVFVGLGDPP